MYLPPLSVQNRWHGFSRTKTGEALKENCLARARFLLLVFFFLCEESLFLAKTEDGKQLFGWFKKHTILIPRGKFGPPYPGKATVAARAALSFCQ